MKDYDHVILWVDYFNKELRKSKGRRVRRDRAVSDPTVKELEDAARAAGFNPAAEEINDQARFPRRPYVRSGYIMLAKKEGTKKSQMIDAIAQKMLQKRSRQKSGQK